eukprot:COSAG01_NODE_8269_length_2849_cov_3.143636_2_plen_303_part_00
MLSPRRQLLLLAGAVAALSVLSGAGVATAMPARHEVVREADVAASTVFRDFGAVSMYDAIAQFDPMVPACGGVEVQDSSCCGDGVCQQSCLAAHGGGCVGGFETPQNCPADCPADAAASSWASARRQFELTTPAQQRSPLFPGLATTIRHPEYHCHSETSSDYDVYDDPRTQPRWFLGRPSKELAALFADHPPATGASHPPYAPNDAKTLAAAAAAAAAALPPALRGGPQRRRAAGLTALDLGCGDGRDTRFLASLGFRTTGVDISVPSIRRALQLRAAATAAPPAPPAAVSHFYACIGSPC